MRLVFSGPEPPREEDEAAALVAAATKSEAAAATGNKYQLFEQQDGTVVLSSSLDHTDSVNDELMAGDVSTGVSAKG